MKRSEFTVRVLSIAESDLFDIITYISSDRPSAADRFAARIEKSLCLLSKQPYLGRIPKEDDLARLGYRYLVVDNYLIFYVVEGKTIYIHRILHGARDYLPLF
jgi:plasmid stabilization system protein ParE